MNTQVQKIKKILKEFGEKLKVWSNAFYKLGTGETKVTRPFLFLFFSWFSLLFFFSFFMLAEQNPFRLLLPFEIYSFPSLDKRTLVTVYISNGEGETLPVKRKLLIEPEFSNFLYQLVGEVGAPPYFDFANEGSEKAGLFSPKKQLDVRYALRQIWVREKNKSIILDWNVSKLEYVMEAYRLPKIQSATGDGDEEPNANIPTDTLTYYSGGNEATQKESDDELHLRRIQALHSTFVILNETLLANSPDTVRIEHRFTGEVSRKNGWEMIPKEFTR